MLLLLVIFMITAPMMQGGVDITLPSTEAKPIESKDGLTISVNKRGRDLHRRREVQVAQRVPDRVQGAAEEPNAERRVSQGRPRASTMGSWLQVLAAMYAAGVTNVGLITEPEEIK